MIFQQQYGGQATTGAPGLGAGVGVGAQLNPLMMGGAAMGMPFGMGAPSGFPYSAQTSTATGASLTHGLSSLNTTAAPGLSTHASPYMFVPMY